MITTYDRLARAWAQLRPTVGARTEDNDRIRFATEQIEAAMTDMRGRRCCTPVAPSAATPEETTQP